MLLFAFVCFSAYNTEYNFFFFVFDVGIKFWKTDSPLFFFPGELLLLARHLHSPISVYHLPSPSFHLLMFFNSPFTFLVSSSYSPALFPTASSFVLTSGSDDLNFCDRVSASWPLLVS